MFALPPTPPLRRLISRPGEFFAALSALPPNPWRYTWLVLLAGLASGLAAATTARATVAAQAALKMPGLSAPATYGTLVFSGVFLVAISWLLLWFLGNLGAGKAGRAAEVYGASFSPQLLWSLLLALLGLCIFPQVQAEPPHLSGLNAQQTALALQRYSQDVAAQVAAHPALRLSRFIGYGVYLWQLALAYLGLRQLSGPRQALAGVLYPAALFATLQVVLVLLSGAASQLLART